MAEDTVAPFPSPAKVPARSKKSRAAAAERARRYRERRRNALVLAERHVEPATNADTAPVSTDSVTLANVTVMPPERHALASRHARCWSFSRSKRPTKQPHQGHAARLVAIIDDAPDEQTAIEGAIKAWSGEMSFESARAPDERHVLPLEAADVPAAAQHVETLANESPNMSLTREIARIEGIQSAFDDDNEPTR